MEDRYSLSLKSQESILLGSNSFLQRRNLKLDLTLLSFAVQGQSRDKTPIKTVYGGVGDKNYD